MRQTEQPSTPVSDAQHQLIDRLCAPGGVVAWMQPVVRLHDLVITGYLSGPGQVRCWLWQGPGGKDDYMVHTKFMSVDGKVAIAGSANLIPRSLQSPFTADGQPLLFNEELVLYIADPHFVATLDEQLFETDVRRSREAGPAELQALIEARGGALDQLIERLKGLMS